jgi:hypothetical protein
VLTQLGILISGLAIHPVVNMVSFSLSFEVSHTPVEARHGVAVATTSPYVCKQLDIPQVEKSKQFRVHFYNSW